MEVRVHAEKPVGMKPNTVFYIVCPGKVIEKAPLDVKGFAIGEHVRKKCGQQHWITGLPLNTPHPASGTKIPARPGSKKSPIRQIRCLKCHQLLAGGILLGNLGKIDPWAKGGGL